MHSASPTESPTRPLVRRVQIRNYKSIASANVELGALRFLVGPNGSGKSNFLDALRFVADALNTTLEQALRDRGGVQAVRRQSTGHPNHFSVRVDLAMPDGRGAFLAFSVGAERDGGFVVEREECRISSPMGPEAFFVVVRGALRAASCEIRSALERDRLALVAISGLSEFRPVYDALRRMHFYNLNPDQIRRPQDPDPGQALARDGRNLAAVIRELGRADGGEPLKRVVDHLAAVVPGIVGVTHKTLGPLETIEFRQKVSGASAPWRFLAGNMSDGTVRALGVIVAALQAERPGTTELTLVGIEEPELALHPGATDVVADALFAASERVQVLVTTHSPALLDHRRISEEHLLAVSGNGGGTVVAPVDQAARAALRDRLYRAGELLAQGQLEPDLAAAHDSDRQLRFFTDAPDER